MTTPTVPAPARHHRSPGVLAVLRSPRLLSREALAGLVVALALIPEAIAFSVIAGVDPRVGLFSSFVMAVTTAIVGGRPAMISAATGAVALVIAPVMREHGIDYFIATVMLAGLIQVALGALGVARLMRFIPRSVMVGFVNALAILVLLAQLPQLVGVPFAVYPLVAVGIVLLIFVPRLTRAVPAPLVVIVLLTAVVAIAGIAVPTVGGQGELPRSLPTLFLPQVPLTLETLGIIGPAALGMAAVGLLESLLTAKLVDRITDTGSNKTRESIGQGIANVASDLFGGMGGCAVVGQTMMNVKSAGASTRVSTFLAGAFLLLLVVGLGDLVGMIPMAALVAVMIMVCVATFDWHSVRLSTLRRMPAGETAVMLITVAVVVATHNLAIGVAVGVLVATVVFARRVANVVSVERSIGGEGEAAISRYVVTGELFFASSNELTTRFAYADDPATVEIDLSAAHIWDASTVAAIDDITDSYSRRGITATVIGLNPASGRIHERLSGRLGGE